MEKKSNPKGLTDHEAQALILKYGKNELTQKNSNTGLKILARIILEPVIAILILCAIIYFSLGTATEAIMMAATVVLAISMSWIQEFKTERALQSLKKLSSPRTNVLRNGVARYISSIDLVPGDIIILHEGDRIPADGTVIDCKDFFADESIVTGESVAIEKQTEDKIFSGTLAVRGEATALITETGNNSTVGKIGTSLKEITDERTLLQKRMTKLGQTLSVIALIICSIVFVLSLKIHQSWQNSLLASLATAIAMMPEEFPMVLTIYLAIGSWRLSKISVLARRASAVENLGAISVLCVDKTGTLTLNEMSVEKIAGDEKKIIQAAVCASEIHATDPMEKALIKKQNQLQLTIHSQNLISSIAVSKEFTAYRSLYEYQNSLKAYTKGAPETVIGLCALNENQKDKIKNAMEQLAREGYRVLGVAQKFNCAKDDWEKPSWDWLGLIAFLDPLRSEVPAAVMRCYEAGIDIKMLTGDHPSTAVTIAKMVGIKNSEKVVTGSELQDLSYFDLSKKILETNVYARVKPEQKLVLIQELKNKGHHVAMTGDGVNDAPALKAAHIGVAMGKRGADVAREAADIVLLDDNFSSMVNAIQEGRRIYQNIQKSFSFLLGVHVIIGLLSFVPMLFGFPPILFPLHLVIMEFIVDPSASIVFAHETASEELMKTPPRHDENDLFTKKELKRLVLVGTLMTGIIITAFWFMLKNAVVEERARLICFSLLNFFVFVFLFGIIKSNEAKKWGIKILLFTLGIFAIIIFVPAIREALHMH